MSALEELAASLAATSDALYSATLVSDQAPITRAAHDWITRPRLGDLVCVHFTRRETLPLHRVGTWVASWSYLHPLDVPECYEPHEFYSGRETVHGIETFEGELWKWTDVELHRIPRGRAERMEMDPMTSGNAKRIGATA